MIRRFGPFNILDNSSEELVRNYTCENYPTCLDLAAALNWENFTCRDCCGEYNKALSWRALHAQKTDGVAQRICKIPEPSDTKKDEVA